MIDIQTHIDGSEHTVQTYPTLISLTLITTLCERILSWNSNWSYLETFIERFSTVRYKLSIFCWGLRDAQ